jgi:hypothetical protein
MKNRIGLGLISLLFAGFIPVRKEKGPNLKANLSHRC